MGFYSVMHECRQPGEETQFVNEISFERFRVDATSSWSYYSYYGF